MKKEFVPYGLALRMKGLGFNEPCFGHYSNEELVYSSHTNNIMQRFRYSAPLYQQAFRWFKEKYNWHSNILGDSLNGKSIGYYFSITEEGWINFYESCDDNKWYSTYVEAELACLEKLIEIVEQTNAEMTEHGVYK